MNSFQTSVSSLTQHFKNFVQHNIKNFTMVFALILIWLLFGVLTNWIFFSPRNLSNLFRQMSIIGFLTIGMVLVIVTGNIDLSVGSVTGFISTVIAFLQVSYFPFLFQSFAASGSPQYAWFSTALAIFAALVVGLAIGALQGSIIAYLRVPAFIVTLGGMMIFRGGVLGVTQGKTIVPIEDPLIFLAQGYIPKTAGYVIAVFVIVAILLFTVLNRQKQIKFGFKPPALWKIGLKSSFFSLTVLLYVIIMNAYKGVQIPVLILAVVAVIISYVAANTRLGRYTYAIGGNREATRLSGINIRRTLFQVFLLMGTLAGVAGIVLTGYVAAGTTGGGDKYELDTIAACVIGGTSLMGGEGTISGALVGALIMASLINGMSVMNMDIFWQYVIKGLVLVLAVLIDVLSKRSK